MALIVIELMLNLRTYYQSLGANVPGDMFQMEIIAVVWSERRKIMAVKICPKCNSVITDNADSCPSCGHPLYILQDTSKTRKSNKILIFGICSVVVIIIVGIGIYFGIFSPLRWNFESYVTTIKNTNNEIIRSQEEEVFANSCKNGTVIDVLKAWQNFFGLALSKYKGLVFTDPQIEEIHEKLIKSTDKKVEALGNFVQAIKNGTISDVAFTKEGTTWSESRFQTGETEGDKYKRLLKESEDNYDQFTRSIKILSAKYHMGNKYEDVNWVMVIEYLNTEKAIGKKTPAPEVPVPEAVAPPEAPAPMAPVAPAAPPAAPAPTAPAAPAAPGSPEETLTPDETPVAPAPVGK